MSNSSLVTYTKISPNRTVNRNHAIDIITPHCVVGQTTIEALGTLFADSTRQASSNYGIDRDARVGMFCEEKDRSWCTGGEKSVNGFTGRDNDFRAVTIECASDANSPYAFKAIVYDKLIELCADICERNGKTKLIWIDNAEEALSYKLASNEMLLTAHRWFAYKECPGDWLYERMGDLAAKVNAELSSATELPKEEREPVYRIQVGAFSKIEKANAFKSKMDMAGFASIIARASDGFYKILHGKFDTYADAQAQIKKVRQAGYAAFITKSTQHVEVANNSNDLKIGDKVKLQSGAPVYGESRTFAKFVYTVTLYVRYIDGNRIVISTNKDGALTGAVDKKYLTKI